MNGSTDVVFSPGRVYRRRDLHAKFGGQRQGEISTPARAPFIFLITGGSGKQHGYSDEWTDDGIFLYTGEGQRGDMRFVAGNRAIRDHLKDGKALQVFEQDKKDKRFLRYLGEMEYLEHAYREAPDTDGKQRKAIVFHLRPVGTLAPDPAVVAAALSGDQFLSEVAASVPSKRTVVWKRLPLNLSPAATKMMAGPSVLLKRRSWDTTCVVTKGTNKRT